VEGIADAINQMADNHGISEEATVGGSLGPVSSSGQWGRPDLPHVLKSGRGVPGKRCVLARLARADDVSGGAQWD
jgi:hypothetical protein